MKLEGKMRELEGSGGLLDGGEEITSRDVIGRVAEEEVSW